MRRDHFEPRLASTIIGSFKVNGPQNEIVMRTNGRYNKDETRKEDLTLVDLFVPLAVLSNAILTC